MKKKRFYMVLSTGLLVTFLASCNGNNNGGATGSRYEATLTFDAGYATDESIGKVYEGYWQKYDKSTGNWVDVPGRTQSFTFKKGMVLSRVWDNIFYKDNTEYRPAVYGHTYEHTAATEDSLWYKYKSEEKLKPTEYHVENDETFEIRWSAQESVSVTFGIAYDSTAAGDEVEWTTDAVEHNFVKSLPSLQTYVAREVKEPKETLIPNLKVYDDEPKPDHPQLPALDGFDKSGKPSTHTYTNPDIKIKDEAKTNGWKFAKYTYKTADSTSYYGDEININTFTFTTPGTLYFHFIQDGKGESFASTSWNEIIAYADQGYDALKERFKTDYVANNNSFVGLTHKVNIYEDPENPEIATEYNARVIGECTDNVVTDVNSKATLTFQFDELVNSSIGWAKNPHGTGGETPNANSNSNIRKYLKSTFPSSLSSSGYIYDQNNVLSYDKLQTVDKKTMHGYNGTAGEVTIDNNSEKFFALSLDETDFVSAENVRVENNKEGVEEKFYAREGNLYPYYQSYSDYSTTLVNGTYGYMAAHIGASSTSLQRHDARLGKKVVNDTSGQNYDYWLRSPIAEDQATAYSVVQKSDIKLLDSQYAESKNDHPYIEYNQQETKYIKDIDRAAGVAPAFCIGTTLISEAPKHKGTLTIPANSDVVAKVEVYGNDGTIKKTYEDFPTETKINLYDDIYEGTGIKIGSYNDNRDVKFKVTTKAGKTLGTGYQGIEAAGMGTSEGISPLQVAEYGPFNPSGGYESIPSNIDYALPVVYDGFTGSVENLRTGFASCTCPGDSIVAIAQGGSNTVEYECRIPFDFLTSDFNVDLVGVDADQQLVSVERSDAFGDAFHFYSSTEPMKSIVTGKATEFLVHKRPETDISKLEIYMEGSNDYSQQFSYKLTKDTDYTVTAVTGLEDYYTVAINASGMTLKDGIMMQEDGKPQEVKLNFDYNVTTYDSNLPAEGGKISSEDTSIEFTVLKNFGSPTNGHPYMFALSAPAEKGYDIVNNLKITVGNEVLTKASEDCDYRIGENSDGTIRYFYFTISKNKVTDNVSISVVTE